MRKQEWIIVLGTIALDTILFFIGSFLLYWGVWNYLFGHGTRPAGLESVMMVSGGLIIFTGIYVIFELVAYLLPKRGVVFFE